MKILISACLLGYSVRYDGKSKINETIRDLSKEHTLIPVCPEVLGGLSTPRVKAEIKDDKVINFNGEDVSDNYFKGANIVLDIAKLNNVDLCILKSKSPSCGSNKIYDGNFNGTLIKGDGIATRLLKDNGFKVIDESEILSLKRSKL